MHIKRTIALVGAGKLAEALATLLVKGNNRLLLFSSCYADAGLLVASIKNSNASADIEAEQCSYTASWEADIIITAIPSSELRDFVTYIKKVCVQKIFVVAEMVNEADNSFLNAVDETKETLPYTHIVQSFLNIGEDHSISYSVKGNNKQATQTTNDLFEEAGLLQSSKSLLH